MNPDNPRTPREEMETWLTSLLLGELSEGEAAAVRELMKHDAELAQLHERLAKAMSFVREVAAQKQAQPGAEPLKLGEERRQKLLAGFKIPPLKPEHLPATSGRRFRVTLIDLLVVIAAVAILAAMFMPVLSTSQHRASSVVVANNLRQIEVAKQMWADENQKPVGAAPTMEDLKPYLGGRGEMASVSGEHYSVGRVGEPAQATSSRGTYTYGKPFQPQSKHPATLVEGDGKELRLPLGGKDGGDTVLAETPRLETRTWRVDPNTFRQALESVQSVPLGNVQTSQGGGGGGGKVAFANDSSRLVSAANTTAQSPADFPITGSPGPTTTIVLPDSGDQDGKSDSKITAGVAGFYDAHVANVERVPLPIQYPAPTLKGTPEDLPSGPNIEPLGETLATRGGARRPERARPEAPPAAVPTPANNTDNNWDFSVGDKLQLATGGGVERTPAVAGKDLFANEPQVAAKAEAPQKFYRITGNGAGGMGGGGGGQPASAAPASGPATGLSVETPVVAANDAGVAFAVPVRGLQTATPPPSAAQPVTAGKPAGQSLAWFDGSGRSSDKADNLKQVELLPTPAPATTEYKFEASGRVANEARSGLADSLITSGLRPKDQPIAEMDAFYAESLNRAGDGAVAARKSTQGEGFGVNAGQLALGDAPKLGQTFQSSQIPNTPPPASASPTLGYYRVVGDELGKNVAQMDRTEPAPSALPGDVQGNRGGGGGTGGGAVLGGIVNVGDVPATPVPATVTPSDGSAEMELFRRRYGIATTLGSGQQSDSAAAANNTSTPSAGRSFSDRLNGIVSRGASSSGDLDTETLGRRHSGATTNSIVAGGGMGGGGSTVYGQIESRNAFGLKEQSLPISPDASVNAPASGLGAADAKVRSLQTELGTIRQQMVTSDLEANGFAPPPQLETETLRNFERLKTEGETKVVGMEKQLDQLKQLDKRKLREVLPVAKPDSQLSEWSARLNQADQKLLRLKTDLGVDHPDVKREQATVEDLNKKIDKRTDDVLAALKVETETARTKLDKLKDTVEEARKKDLEKAEASRPYFDKKRELQEAIHTRDVLAMKIATEKIDVNIPKTMMVEVVENAVPAKEKSGSFLGLVGGSYASTARVKVFQDVSDTNGLSDRGLAVGAYDPYFTQTEYEVIKSDKVLGKVVDELNLKQEWGKKYANGQKLTTPDAIALLKKRLDIKPLNNTSLTEIKVKSDDADEAAKLANAVALTYHEVRQEQRREQTMGGIRALEGRFSEQEKVVQQKQAELDKLRGKVSVGDPKFVGIMQREVDTPPVRKPSTNAPIPQPEIQTSENNFSTFSLNVSDVSFKLAMASLEKGQMPDAASVRSEEFINAFDYRDPEPQWDSASGLSGQTGGTPVPLAFAWERARYPFAHNRDLLRFSLKTAAAGRQAGRPLNIVLLLDNSGSMERADRVRIIREALRVLAGQLQPQDKLSVITFARTPRLVADGISGDKAGEVTEAVAGLTPQGGTNLEDAMNLAYQTAAKHYLANGINRVVLLTDGAANLGDVEPDSLKQKVEAQRKQGIALDCFGIGWDGFNDDLLEVLSRNGDGRYGFINSPEEAATDFVGQLAGALKVAASDVKVQVEFNPHRVTSYRQIGYAKHQLTKEQFRDNTVDAAEIAAQEAGNALYTVEVNPAGEGPLCTVRVRYKIPGTTDYREQAWDVPHTGNALSLEQSSPAMRLAASAAAFAEWLVASPFAGEVTPDRVLNVLSGVPEVYGADGRPKKLEWMIRQAKSIEGK